MTSLITIASHDVCGMLEHGFLTVLCDSCHDEKLVAVSSKRRGFRPRCGARRMVDSAALLVDEVLPRQPMRQWVLSVPFPLRFLFASKPKVMARALAIVYRTIATHLTRKAGFTKPTAQTGAVTLIQRFGSGNELTQLKKEHGQPLIFPQKPIEERTRTAINFSTETNRSVTEFIS